MDENQLSSRIIDAAVEVKRTLGGPGLLESVYEEALAVELVLRGLRVRRQSAIPLVYKGFELSSSLRLDLVVNDSVIVECKAVSKYHEIFASQALTYLRLTGKRLALVINFHHNPLRQGIYRIVNKLPTDR